MITTFFNIFTHKNYLRTFVEKCHESHLCAFVGQILQGARIRWWGGQPNFGNARILGPYGPPTPPLKGEERKGTRPSSRERVSVGADPSSPTPSLLGEPNIIICKNNITFFPERGAHADMDLCGGTPLPRLHSLVIVGVYLQCCACIAYCTGNVSLCLTYNFFQDRHLNLSFAKGL